MSKQGYCLRDVLAYVNFDRIGQMEGRTICFVGGIGPVALVLHLEELSLETELYAGI
jgi:hypothetical protein